MALSGVLHVLGRDRFDPADFEIVSLEMTIPAMDPAFVGYRIVQFTDIHMGHWINAERLEGVVNLVNRQVPDLVVITGDFVSYVIAEISADMVAALSKLDPHDATLAVLGNHDHWMGADNVRRILQDSGVIELRNDVYVVERGGARLYIAGVDDITVGANRLEVVLARLDDDSPAILLAHEPDFAVTSAATGRFALQLSGHSHGGQVVFPGIGPLIRGPMFWRYPNGRYQVGDMVQYTNRGIGTHVLRLRVNCPPEITCITLR